MANFKEYFDRIIVDPVSQFPELAALYQMGRSAAAVGAVCNRPDDGDDAAADRARRDGALRRCWPMRRWRA